MLYGYARVSTSDQDTRLQLDALNAAGVQFIAQEKASAVSSRPELQRLLSLLGSGDVLVVYKLDRIARSLKDLLGILDRLDEAKCGFRSLTEPIDTTTPVGLLILQILGAVAQFERSLIRERALTGQIAALRSGVKFGRPKVLKDYQEDAVYRAYLFLNHNKKLTARYFGVTHPVVTRIVLEREGKKMPGVDARPVWTKLLASEQGK